tara:strand:- start:1859 stop:2566 length:708 start_codon:yes stop_codon:yes gene_type:complete
MKILRPKELGTGILIEYDAGHISPSDQKNLIKEFKDPSANDVMMYAVLQKCGVENRNGRVYPRDVLQREVERYQKLIGQGRALSELNHPESSLVDLERSSHRIVETFWDGDVLMGKLEILTSPAYHKSGIISCVGDIAANLLRHGVTLGISSRGVGSLKQKGGQNLVQDDFELICFDLVSSPSTPGAYLFKDRDGRQNYEESLEEERIEREESSTETPTDSLRLMNKLDAYLGNY